VKPDSGPWDLERLRSIDAPELHHALDAVRQQLPDPQQLAALAASLAERGISVTPSNHASATPSAIRLKLLLGAGVVVPLAVALLLWRSPAPPPTAARVLASPAPSAAHALGPAAETPRAIAVGPNGPSQRPTTLPASNSAPESPPSPSSKASEPAAINSAPQPAASPEPVRWVPRVAAQPTASAERMRSSATPVHASPESIGPGVVTQPTEVALLRDARLALGGNPGEALALAERHRALFAHGAMVQERELIAISALARLGRHTAVLARAAQFEHDFPNSPYRKQVSALAQ